MKFGFKDYFLMYKARGIRLPISYFFQNHLFDLINSTDTHVWLPKENYVDKPKYFDHGVLYMSSWTSIVKKATLNALHLLSLTPDDVAFVDVGCGKGKVLCVWSQMFLEAKKIAGVDYSQHLLGICRNNLEKLSASDVELICGDAAEINLEFGCDVNLLYLYNPFDDELLDKFLKNQKKKKTVMIYSNPVHKDIVLENGFHQLYEEKAWHPNADFAILSNIYDSQRP